MAEEGGEEGKEGEGKLSCVDHGPLNEGAVGQTELVVIADCPSVLIFKLQLEHFLSRMIYLPI